jgi:hypothetical protein
MAAVGALLISSGIALMAVPTTATAVSGSDEHPQVCLPLDSGKIDVSGNQQSVEVTAPEGMLIDQYCVKAGSINQGDGPVYVDVTPPQSSVTITYTDQDGRAKDISHYSLSYTEVPVLDEARADLTWTQASCENDNQPTYAVTEEEFVDHWTQAVPAEGPFVAGEAAQVIATAEEGHVFADGESTKAFDTVLDAPETGCTVTPPVVEPPVVEPPVEQPTETVTPTVVEAGLLGETDSGTTRDQGLALVATGLVLMAAAGALAVRKEGETR